MGEHGAEPASRRARRGVPPSEKEGCTHTRQRINTTIAFRMYHNHRRGSPIKKREAHTGRKINTSKEKRKMKNEAEVSPIINNLR